MARRQTNVFSLSFLDVMSCGFGAVVLIFLIINHATQETAEVINQDLLSEIRLLDYQVQNGERDLVELKEELEALLQAVSDSDQQLNGRPGRAGKDIPGENRKSRAAEERRGVPGRGAQAPESHRSGR